MNQELVEFIRAKIENSKQMAILTGAGISAESGIPTFRGEGGLWRNYRAEDLATVAAFTRDPILVWEWYEMRMGICQKAEPNPGHKAIAAIEKEISNVRVFTQNVDGLHVRAGSKSLIELHGNIFTGRCVSCSKLLPNLSYPLDKNPPICQSCGGILRPHIVWFGESYDGQVLDNAMTYMRNSDLILIIGTSGQVTVPVYLAQEAIRSGAYSIEINPEESTLTESVNLSLRGKSGEILSQVWLNF